MFHVQIVSSLVAQEVCLCANSRLFPRCRARRCSQRDDEADVTAADSACFVAVCDGTYFSYDLMM